MSVKLTLCQGSHSDEYRLTQTNSGLILWLTKQSNVPLRSGLRLDEKLKALTAWTRESLCEGQGRENRPTVLGSEREGSGVGHVALLVFVFQHWADSTIWRMRLSDPS